MTAIRREYSRASFIVTDANRTALALGEDFLKSGALALTVTGPNGSGKSHLLHVLAQSVNGQVLNGVNLDPAEVMSGPFLFVDDIHRMVDPRTLLSLVEQGRLKNDKIILSGAGVPRDWARGLVDLETRLEAMARASLDEPDEVLLKSVIMQLFKERQLRTSEGVAAYAAPRLPRTFAAASDFVEAAGAASLAAGRPITLALARNVIDNLSEAGQKA